MLSITKSSQSYIFTYFVYKYTNEQNQLYFFLNKINSNYSIFFDVELCIYWFNTLLFLFSFHSLFDSLFHSIFHSFNIHFFRYISITLSLTFCFFIYYSTFTVLCSLMFSFIFRTILRINVFLGTPIECRYLQSVSKQNWCGKEHSRTLDLSRSVWAQKTLTLLHAVFNTLISFFLFK